MIAAAPVWFENLLSGWWGTLILTLFCGLDAMLLSVIFYRAFMKRFYDIVLSMVGIILLTPLWLLLTPIVALKMKGNPFFVQPRPGKKTKIFQLIKYRTMTQVRDADGNLLPDAERLTRFGSLMRKLSLDELPELFNIFLGQMSLIGPRPLLVRYVPLYTREQARRHEVRPGLTGLAQVNGRNAIDWEQRFALDVFYVDHYSFFGDVKIFFLTILKVFQREGISEEGHATKSYFMGADEANAPAPEISSYEPCAAMQDADGDTAGEREAAIALREAAAVGTDPAPGLQDFVTEDADGDTAGGREAAAANAEPCEKRAELADEGLIDGFEKETGGLACEPETETEDE